MGSNDEQPPARPKKRAGSIMGDEERAMQPRPRHDAVPTLITHEQTPPPILIDDVGKPIARTSEFAIVASNRKRVTAQDAINELWPARRALPLVLEQLERLVKLETKVEEMEANGPAQVSRLGVEKLRMELVGDDGEGGIIGAFKDTLARDLTDHRKVVDDVAERALKADKFVRRVIYAAGGTIGGALIAAVALIYSAGEHAATARAEAAANRLMIDHKIDELGDSLTDIRGQVRLLLEEKLR